MKKLTYLLTLLLIVPIVGCELFNDEEDTEVKFINLSSYTVHVQPNGQLWPAFAIEPGESHSVDTSHEIFFEYEPDWAVEVGDNENGRIYFTNIGAEQVD